MKAIGIIPARYRSTRFPGKPLAVIKGVSLLERVWRQAGKARKLDEVVIATDDRRIVAAAASFGAAAVMTSSSCHSGTDRLAEVARRKYRDAGIFINIQGDEPLISPRLIDRLAAVLKSDPSVPAVTAAYPLSNPRDISDPNIVKVVCDLRSRALYFSRSPIPCRRSRSPIRILKHLGIYGYRRDFLLRFSAWRPTPLEQAEQLEQLRILEKGYELRVVISAEDSFGVDVPTDVIKIERLIQ